MPQPNAGSAIMASAESTLLSHLSAKSTVCILSTYPLAIVIVLAIKLPNSNKIILLLVVDEIVSHNSRGITLIIYKLSQRIH